jgi:hypothetical protein
MTSKVARLTPAGRARVLAGLRRSWKPGGAHDLRFHRQQADADTLRSRALYDRRGTVVLAGHCNTQAGAVPIAVRYSTAGRSDQLDVFLDNRLLFTASAARAMPELMAFLANPS